ncbi:MAG: hypothetical protein JSR58_00820 [Verrucomicrobia bacterium]|nr:hypothetical protein [Verrucomicrobiota bacterium]
MLKWLFSLFFCTALMANPLMGPPSEIIVHNRILAKVQGKSISTLDVMKKMDVFISDHYPEIMDSPQGKFQFYQSQWRNILDQLIDAQLMIADAENREHKITVSDGELREEVMLRFGPNVMGTLDKLHLSYEEARRMVHDEMIMQRMQWFRVSSKALQRVTAQDVKDAYTEFCRQNPPKEEWKYQVLTIRAPTDEMGKSVAETAMSLLREVKEGLVAVADTLKQQNAAENDLVITVSSDYTVEDKSLSQNLKQVLSVLKEGEFSPPQSPQNNVYRLYHLKEHKKIETPSFPKMASRLKDSLLNKAASEEMEKYMVKLRKRFGYETSPADIPAEFQPFSLQ